MIQIFVFLFSLFSVAQGANNPNPPEWPSNVKIFTTATPTSEIQAVADAIFATNGGKNDNGHFVNVGYALLFAPGTYTELNINIGYYTSIMGLGINISDTEINSVSSPQGNDDPTIGALNSFWRSAENFSTTPAEYWYPTGLIGMTWAVSQAAPLRKVNVNGLLFLFQLSPNYASGYSSGGFMADCTVTGTLKTESAITSGSQQQWITRNSDMSVPPDATKPAWSNGVWNQVFVGCIGAPDSHCSNCPNGEVPPCSCKNCHSTDCTTTCTGNPYTNVEKTPVIAEKPFIVTDSAATKYSLYIPQIEYNKVGTSKDNNSPVDTVDFSEVYVATSADTAETINSAINEGCHIILTPGTYNLTDSIKVNQANTVVLGIGFPILISTTGKPCIVVGSVNGVRVGGVLLQAGPSVDPVTPTLLQWGSKVDQSITSGFLYDCFARCGRFSGDPAELHNQTNLFVQINSSNVVCDNLWLWRADHDSIELVHDGENSCLTGCEINGDNVTAYGLCPEHTLNDLCRWNGNNGRCYMFQAEFPYDVKPAYGELDYTGYRVDESVILHEGYGIGLYSFFRDYANVYVKSGMYAPASPGIKFTNCLTRYLNGNGGILAVLNGNLGLNPNAPSSAVNANYPGPAYLCNYVGTVMQPRTRSRRM